MYLISFSIDLDIEVCINDEKKGTKKTKEMKQLVVKFREEVAKIMQPQFDSQVMITN